LGCTTPDDYYYEYAHSMRQKYGWNMSPLEKEISDIIDCGFELIRISRPFYSKLSCYVEKPDIEHLCPVYSAQSGINK